MTETNTADRLRRVETVLEVTVQQLKAHVDYCVASSKKRDQEIRDLWADMRSSFASVENKIDGNRTAAFVAEKATLKREAIGLRWAIGISVGGNVAALGWIVALWVSS